MTSHVTIARAPRSARWKHCLRIAGAFAVAAALSGCVVYPAYGPRYGYYHPYPRYYW